MTNNVYTTRNATKEQDVLTIEAMKEAVGLIRALAPREHPSDVLFLRVNALKIVKNEMLFDDTIIVSKRLFDMLYESGCIENEQDNTVG
jgi:hypothetical protein